MHLRSLLLLVVLIPLACAPQRRGGTPTLDEICDDGIDNDEDGTVDEGEDDDNDGFLDCGVEDLDCDDQDADVHPGAGETCDGIDNDCDGAIDEDFPDGCGDDDDATDDDDAVEEVIIVDMSPEPGADDHFLSADLFVVFNQAPDSVELSVAGVTGATETSSNGRVVTFDPSNPLEPNTEYLWTITWSPSIDSPIEIEFETGPHGDPVGDPDAIIGRAYQIDVANADFTEPAGVGAILGSQLDGMVFLMAATPESSGSDMHVILAQGEESAGNVSQLPCVTTTYATAGPDQVIGTADDAPGDFDNPDITVGPVDLAFDAAIQGIGIGTVNDVFMTSTFHPALDDLQGGIVEGTIDTRPLAPELDPDGDEDALCQLLEEVVGVEFRSCLAQLQHDFREAMR